MIKAIHVYDIDGVLVDSSHRYRTMIREDGKEVIDLQHWREHDKPEFIEKDSLLPMAEQYKSDLKNPEIYVIIATARLCSANDANYHYIEQVLGLPDKFAHRKESDGNTSGAVLKIKAIRPLLNLKQFKNVMIHVFEDNIDYLKKMVDTLGGIGHYIPSKQGH